MLQMLDAMKSYLHRISERQKSEPAGRRRTVYTIFHNMNGMKISWLTLENKRGEVLLGWRDTRKIEAFKRDLYATDVICLAVASRDNKTVEINEEMSGWKSLVDKLPTYLPECLTFKEWFDDVAFPAFKPNLRVIYQRDS